jgi:phosphoglycerate dehydrogenase-like enzyme
MPRFKFVFLPPVKDTQRQWAERLARDVPEADVVVAETREDALREIPDAGGVFGTLDPELLQAARELRWLQAPAIAPPAGFYFKELIEHPSQATNFREIFNDHIAAHIMMYVLAFARGLHYYFRRQLAQEYRPEPLDTGVVHLPESTALIVGVGGIGSEAARHCAHFGMRVLGIDARRESAPEGVAELHRPDALDALLPRADFVILTIPHTPQTEGLFDRARFQRMKRGAFFINIGRGKTTRLHDLDAALRAGEIAGAGLDVYEEEPLPAGHPLWTAPNTILTPHTAGFGPYLDERRYEIVRDNARRFAAGQPLRNVVDKANWF